MRDVDLDIEGRVLFALSDAAYGERFACRRIPLLGEIDVDKGHRSPGVYESRYGGREAGQERLQVRAELESLGRQRYGGDESERQR